jgi:serine protease Do
LEKVNHMIDPATTSPKARSTRKLISEKPVAFILAGALGLGLLGTALIPASPHAIAQASAASGGVTMPFGAPSSFADLVEKARPAVVSIRVKNGSKPKKSSRNAPEFNMPDLPDGHPLNEFFKNFRKDGPGSGGERRRRPSVAQGSGFFISADGYVVTNHHVIDDASEITITMDNGDEHKAEIIGSDERTDLALLKVKSGK